MSAYTYRYMELSADLNKRYYTCNGCGDVHYASAIDPSIEFLGGRWSVQCGFEFVVNILGASIDAPEGYHHAKHYLHRVN